MSSKPLKIAIFLTVMAFAIYFFREVKKHPEVATSLDNHSADVNTPTKINANQSDNDTSTNTKVENHSHSSSLNAEHMISSLNSKQGKLARPHFKKDNKANAQHENSQDEKLNQYYEAEADKIVGDLIRKRQPFIDHATKLLKTEENAQVLENYANELEAAVLHFFAMLWQTAFVKKLSS